MLEVIRGTYSGYQLVINFADTLCDCWDWRRTGTYWYDGQCNKRTFVGNDTVPISVSHCRGIHVTECPLVGLCTVRVYVIQCTVYKEMSKI